MRNSKFRRGLSAAAIVVLAAGAQVAVQVTAQSTAMALPGAVARGVQTQFTSEDKSVAATCPAGTRVTGGGGRTAGSKNVVITRMEPVHSDDPNVLDSYVVAAEEDETAPTATWAVAAFALCADIPVQVVATFEPLTTVNNFRTGADCPPGTVGLGSGARINGGEGQVHITESFMHEGGSFVTSQENFGGFDDLWSVDAFAVCASIPPEDYVVLQSGVFVPGPEERGIASVTCPPDMRVAGGGIQMDEGHSGLVVTESIDPEFFPGGFPGRRVQVIAREDVARDTGWGVLVMAACVA